MQIQTVATFLYTTLVTQCILNDVLHISRAYTNDHSICVCPSYVLENGGVSGCYTGSDIGENACNKLMLIFALVIGHLQLSIHSHLTVFSGNCSMICILYAQHGTEPNEANLADSTQSKTVFSPLTVMQFRSLWSCCIRHAVGGEAIKVLSSHKML